MRAYSLDLRQHALDALDAGRSLTEVAQIFGISVRTLERYRRQLATTERLAAKPIPGRPRRLPSEQEGDLDAQLRAHPTATVAEHCAHWAADHGVHLSCPTMGRAIRRLGWTWKKSRWWPPSKTLLNGSSGATPSVSTIPSSSSSSTSQVPTSP